MIAAVATLTCMMGMVGCQAKDGEPAEGAWTTDATSAVWPFWPRKMRLHPLTRQVIDPQTGKSLIEARVEFQDPDSVTTKAVGQLSLRLYPHPDAPDDSEPLQIWSQDLRDPATNRRQYDDVTRTYLFRLDIDPARLTDTAELRAFFVSADGHLLRATLRLQ